MTAMDTDEWTLDDLKQPHGQIVARGRPTDANLRALASALQDEWVDRTVSIPDLTAWALERYGLDENGVFTVDEFEMAAALRKYQFKQLLRLITEAGIIEDDGELIDRMTAIQRVMHTTHEAVFQNVVLFHRMEPARNVKIPPSVVEEETVEEHDADSLTSFQALLLHILTQMFVRQLRKNGDSCFEEIMTAELHRTHAFRHVCPIQDMVWGVKKEVNFAMWKRFTNPRDNPKAVTEHLIQSSEDEFPSIDVGDGRLFSFENGIYDVRHDLFFAYDDSWAAYAEAMRVARKTAQAYPVPSNGDVAVNYFPIPFRDPPTPDQDPEWDPMDIATPTFEKMFDTQQFDADTRRWAYLMIGRLFFLCNTLDSWQRALFLIGGGGTGKSTIALWLKYVFRNFYSLINTNFEEQFGLGPLCDDRFRLCMCTEMGEDIKMKQEEFQICAEGGEHQAAKKNKDSFPYQWKQHLIFCGNQFPRRWKNNGKQISRRAFLLHFRHQVPKDSVDTQLIRRLEGETDQLIRKCVCLYVRMATAHPTADIEKPGLMPQQVRDFLNVFEAAIDPLMSFLQTGRFVTGPPAAARYMLMDDFKSDYFEYRKANGFGTEKWTQEHYGSTFSALNIAVQRDTRDVHGRPKTANFLIGIDVADDEL